MRSGGLSVVELMVSLALGLLVMLTCSALLVSASASYAGQTEATRLNDSARYALEAVTRAVRQSAFVNWDVVDAPVGTQPEDSANVGGLDARSLARDSEGIDAPLAGAVNGSDVLALRYYGAGTGPGGDGSVINCAGFGVGAGNSEAARGWSIFYVASDASGEAELRCKYRGEKSWGADALVRGVDSFQVLYGIDSDDPADGAPNQYLSATAIAVLDAALVLDGADAAARQRDRNKKTHWKRVVSLKIALLLHGQPGSGLDGVPARFDLFGKDYADAYGRGDPGVSIDEQMLAPALRLRARQLVVVTILLRNRPV
ncbi:MAG TPA: PilW family protein [Janthinobacterium sp.]|nr:PilW family protein [Janthinobacterium sp.]